MHKREIRIESTSSTFNTVTLTSEVFIKGSAPVSSTNGLLIARMLFIEDVEKQASVEVFPAEIGVNNNFTYKADVKIWEQVESAFIALLRKDSEDNLTIYPKVQTMGDYISYGSTYCLYGLYSNVSKVENNVILDLYNRINIDTVLSIPQDNSGLTYGECFEADLIEEKLFYDNKYDAKFYLEKRQLKDSNNIALTYRRVID